MSFCLFVLLSITINRMVLYIDLVGYVQKYISRPSTLNFSFKRKIKDVIKYFELDIFLERFLFGGWK